ncbi:MAG: electron transfer flavoprotein subunit beta [Acidobacteriia bacterium]|nr:electron transfer flavoprotein subunit beta [Terriglobia bacterium]
MHILVLLKMAPDVVEDLEIAPGGKALDLDCLRMILSESDDHALEQALLLKERHGAKITALALDAPEVDDALFTAAAKGADRVMKVVGMDPGFTTREAARYFSQAIAEEPGLLPADLILTGVQAIDDLDGLVAPIVADGLRMPYLGIVTGVALEASAQAARAIKEYPAGVRGEFLVQLPAVLGIQAAEKPPRYVPVAKVRAAMKSVKIECSQALTLADGGLPLVGVVEMKRNEPAGHAEMLEGKPDQVSGQLCGILAERGLF